jgi:hypothetical protein
MVEEDSEEQLLRAVAAGHVDQVVAVLRRRRDRSSSSSSSFEFSCRALSDACKLGHMDSVDVLLTHPAYDGAHMTARVNVVFRVASRYGYVRAVARLLLDTRVDPASSDNYALRCAVYWQHVDTVRLLMADARTDPSANDQEALFDAAVRRGSSNPILVRMLLRDPRTDPSTRRNRTLVRAANVGHVECVELMLADARVDPTIVDGLHSKPRSCRVGLLSWAIRHRSTRAVTLLLADARVVIDDDSMDYLLYEVAGRCQSVYTRSGRCEIVMLLIRDPRTWVTDDTLRGLDAIVDDDDAADDDLLGVLVGKRYRPPAKPSIYVAIVRRRDRVAWVLDALVRTRRVCRDVVHAYVSAFATGVARHRLVELQRRE